jgi:rubrerythrin
MGNERRRTENSKRIIAEQRHWAAMCQLAEEVDEEEEDEETWQRGHGFVAVESVKPVVGTLRLHVISVPKAKKKQKKKRK